MNKQERTDRFQVAELLHIFRAGLLALIPVMDRARIPWREGEAYDPWENIERTLYSSIIGSCVENHVGNDESPLMLLSSYGLSYSDYRSHSFLSERGSRLAGTPNAFLEFRYGEAPFDTAVFVEIDQNQTSTSREITMPLEQVRIELAGRRESGLVYLEEIEFFP